MFTQQETRLAVEKIQNVFKPQITHDMHQMGATEARIFVPPFDDPYDPNVHPILAQEHIAVGQAMASALVSEGKAGVEFHARYDMWTPARQYMVYHGQPRILSEIASVNLADPFVNPAGKDVPLGSQEARWNYPLPYTRSDWHLRQIVDYGETVAFAGMSHVAKYRTTWLENFYRVHADWVNRTAAPYAFVVPAEQRDMFEALEMLDILRIAEVEVQRAQAPFTAGGKQYPAGSWVIKTAQPYGAFAKTMLERQEYPDLRLYPGGPPKTRLRCHRPDAVDADGRQRRSDRGTLRGQSRRRGEAPGGRRRRFPPLASRTFSVPSRTPDSSPSRDYRTPASRPSARREASRPRAGRSRRERRSCRSALTPPASSPRSPPKGLTVSGYSMQPPRWTSIV